MIAVGHYAEEKYPGPDRLQAQNKEKINPYRGCGSCRQVPEGRFRGGSGCC